MQIRLHTYALALALTALLVQSHFGPGLQAQVGNDLEEPALRDLDTGAGTLTKNKKRFMLFAKPKMDTAPKQLEWANSLLEKGETKKAMKAYRALYTRWPSEPEAALGRFVAAKQLSKSGKYEKAGEELTFLLENYAGLFPYEDVLNELFTLGKKMREKKYGKILFGGFKDPKRAIPLFKAIAKHAPSWKYSAEALFMVGETLEKTLKYEDAIDAYNNVQIKYSGTEWAEKSALREGLCLFELSKESPNSAVLSHNAWSSMNRFLLTYPDSIYREEAMNYKSVLQKKIEKSDFTKAEFYDKVVHRPEAALRAYQNFIQVHPNSEWTTTAELRIQELTRVVEQLKKEQKGKSKSVIFN